jgi:ATP-dependent Clp protease ATP-binding subunit ClpB
MAELRSSFRPEFLNRLDDTVLFKTLNLSEITIIVGLLVKELNERLCDRRITVDFDEDACNWIAEKGYDPVYGARPLKRFLQKQVETRMAKNIISGDVKEGDNVTFILKNGELDQTITSLETKK